MKGLTTAQAQDLLKQHGPNTLKTKTANPWYKILFSQFTDLLVLILVIAAVISFFGHDKTEGWIILGIVVLNAAIGFFQEFKTEKTLEALKNMVHPEIRVIRDGQERLLPTEELVPGDIVILGEGDKIPADGVLTESHSLQVEESALTGESLPINKKEEDKVFMGTSVAKGSGIFKVENTGMNTEFGKIAELTVATDKTKSPLQIELGRIGIFVTKVTGVLCVILFGMQLWREMSHGGTWLAAIGESLEFSVSVAIAAVPEGLPTTITIALALGASVLARKKAIVKKLSSVETLGSVSTICSDKTGTLTKNEMTVREVYLADRSIYKISGVGYDPHSGNIHFLGGNKGEKKPSAHNQALLERVMEICQKCNEAKLVETEHVHTVLGDPTEGALLTLVHKWALGDTSHHIFQKSPVEIFPFDSDRKMMSVVAEGRDTEQKSVLVKGSPDQVLEKCTHWFDGEKTQPLDKAKREKIHAHYERMAENALRVLAFAYREVDAVPGDENEAEQDLIFCGLVGMIDPPRAEVKEAVEKCRSAGIRVVVITGDFGITAEAIARELGIVRGRNVRVLTGDEVEKISDDELSEILADKSQYVIFARSLPAQKMRIVKTLQDHGEIVAMTGDGVNDAPALKKANIGVAMGITGTEVSKEAATMILTNDSFASIVTAVEEGRRIYENLKKFVWFIFSCNVGELVVIFASILFVMPLPLTAVLILCIDLGTDILPAIALGVDSPEKNLMAQKPRDPSKKLMSKDFVTSFFLVGGTIGICSFAVFVWSLYQGGWTWADGVDVDRDLLIRSQTMAFAVLVVVQLVNAFATRSFTRSVFLMNPLKNHFLVMAVFTSVLMVILMLYVPLLNTLLKTQPLTVVEWEVILLASFIPVLVFEGIKWFRKHFEAEYKGL